jgi:hypothetical protein
VLYAGLIQPVVTHVTQLRNGMVQTGLHLVREWPIMVYINRMFVLFVFTMGIYMPGEFLIQPGGYQHTVSPVGTV